VFPPDWELLRHLVFAGINLIAWVLLGLSIVWKNVLSLLFFSGVAILVGLLTFKAHRENVEATRAQQINS
jgi:hypothetical protein